MACTGVPDFKLRKCCEGHDKAYAKGGISKDRYRADLQFLACMIERKSKFVSYVYYFGVRLFGWFFFRYGGKPSLIEKVFKRC